MLRIFLPIFAATSFLPLAAAEDGTAKPNIVFVLFDDLGYGQPGCYREDSEFRTPNIDRLAREGMRFTDAHSAAATCTPTRYGLLTGRYPSRIGQFGVLTTYSKPIIPTQRLTVASFLKQNGYATACIGKWHLGLDWEGGKPIEDGHLPIGAKMTGGPNDLGFDYFYGFTHARNIGGILEQDQVVANVEEIENQPLMIRKAVEFIEGRAGKKEPFFLYFPMCPPHSPVVPAPEFEGKGGIEGKESRYGDWVYQGDHMLGEILATLERIGAADNTLVIATGDNGASKRPYAPLRDAKGSIYEGGHREPFIARWRGRIEAGSVTKQTVCLNDFFATCAEILGKTLPDTSAEDSVSILPVLLGKSAGPVREATVHQASGRLALRQGDWKLVMPRNKPAELYNLREDLGETRDMAAANPEVVARMTALMQGYIDNGRSTPGAARKNDVALTLNGVAGRTEKTGGKKKNRKKDREKKAQ